MILFLFAEEKRARSAAFIHHFRPDDRSCVAWWPECDPEIIRGKVFDRVIKVDRMLMTRDQVTLIRSRLRGDPGTWIEL